MRFGGVAVGEGAEGVTFGKQHASSRTTESGSAVLATSAHRRALPNNRHTSCARDAVVERVTATVPVGNRECNECDHSFGHLSVRKALTCREDQAVD